MIESSDDIEVDFEAACTDQSQPKIYIEIDLDRMDSFGVQVVCQLADVNMKNIKLIDMTKAIRDSEKPYEINDSVENLISNSSKVDSDSNDIFLDRLSCLALHVIADLCQIDLKRIRFDEMISSIKEVESKLEIDGNIYNFLQLEG